MISNALPISPRVNNLAKLYREVLCRRITENLGRKKLVLRLYFGH